MREFFEHFPQIFFTGTFGHDVENQRAQQYEINITALADQDTNIVWANRNYSQTGFKVSEYSYEKKICIKRGQTTP